jgi:hypothetical protein
MILPLSESLAVAYDSAPSHLRTPGLKKGLGQIARLLQAGVTSYYFEWHMQQEGYFDLLLLVTQKKSHDFLARLQRERYLSKQPAWDSVIRFISAWSSGNPVPAESIPHIWLAFDFSEKKGTFSAPNIHFCIDRKFSLRDQAPDQINRLSKKQFKTIISSLSDDFMSSESPVFQDQIERCFSLLPEHGEMLHFSIMHARDPWTMKCNIELPKPTLFPFLKKIGWSGDYARLSAVIEDFCSNEKRINFNVLMNKTILNQLELELNYNTPLTSDPRRARALELLCRQGCASKSACSAVTQWPGYDWHTVKNGVWPVKIKKWLDLKLCINEGEKMTAKAYLGFYPFLSIV